MAYPKIDRTGVSKIQQCGMECKIIVYRHRHDIDVQFEDGFIVKNRDYKEFEKGTIKNPYAPNVFGVGSTGNKYQTQIDGKQTKEYNAWRHLIQRCYDEKTKIKQPAYKDVLCCKEWLLYENFHEWLHSQENFNRWLNGNHWCVDKDILNKGNKIYSPENCCLVPPNVNTLFVNMYSKERTLPIGVSYIPKRNLYLSSLAIKGKQKVIGVFKTPNEAFQVYKIEKEKHIQNVAQEEFYKGNISKRCYDAMMNYEVTITD